MEVLLSRWFTLMSGKFCQLLEKGLCSNVLGLSMGLLGPRGQDRSCNVCYAQHLKPHIVTFLESYWSHKAAMVPWGRALHKGIYSKKYLYLCDINYHPTLQVNKLWHKQSMVEQRFECRHSGSKVHTLNNQDTK